MGKGGYLRIEGESVDTEDKNEDGNKQVDEVFDGAGNKITVNKTVTLSEKDKKKEIKEANKKKTLTEEEMWELEDKLTELKESLKARVFVIFLVNRTEARVVLTQYR